MNCKNFKTRTKTIRKKRTIYNYCSLLKKEILYNDCVNCINKEYKCAKKLKSCAKLKKKSNKLAKLEKNRTSLFTDDLSKCILCGSTCKITKHEIFGGRNRINSIKYKLVLPLCLTCHESKQNDFEFNKKWHELGQLKFEDTYSQLQFVSIFKKNYKK